MKTLPFQIIFEDLHLIILSKPAGLLSQGEHTGDENLVSALQSYLGRNYVGLIHRLDRNTSGIMLVAKRTKAARRLTDALQEGKVVRSYLGWVLGELKKPVLWKHFLTKDSEKNIAQVVASTHSGAKAASLRAHPITKGKFKDKTLTLVEFQLETGRSHQIRVQSAHEGYPLLGDWKYNPQARTLAKAFGRPALHSYQISFPHPMSGEILKFEAPLPKDFEKIIRS
ncbi:MAG: RluA family pseudouridine synthase [Deltaproteobacteria bacterium]|nr:RluA family pseudouridine synthase [Deltaproteobacteria bacterium]